MFPKEHYRIVETKGGEVGDNSKRAKVGVFRNNGQDVTRVGYLVRQAMSELVMSLTLLFHMILFDFTILQNVAELLFYESYFANCCRVNFTEAVS